MRETTTRVLGLWLAALLFGGVHLSLGPSSAPAHRVQHVVLDAGHGGHDPGTHGMMVKEKAVALSIARKVEKLIAEGNSGIEVELTRDDDTFIDLYERAAVANKKNADLFVSIHCNANPNRTVYGTETYAMGLHKTSDNLEVVMKENSSILLEENHEEKYDGFDPNSPEAYIIFSLNQNAYLRQSLALASKIEQNFKTVGGRHSRGVKQAGFIVLWTAAMPAVLVETGFLSNRMEEKFMASAEGQTYIAKAIYKGILDYRQGQ